MRRRVIAVGVAFVGAMLLVVGKAEASWLCAFCATLNDSDPAWYFFGCYLITLPCVP